jgi:predicted AlkP superfamily phosphohydrolase/phosphomutase/tetratricopeptide (TPR) repeat protein
MAQEARQQHCLMRLLLVGWDAADWKVIDPLLARGEMPNLAHLIASGVRGNNATIYPPLSPMVWTSIATGKRPTKRGIHGFTELTEDGLSVRSVTNLSRKTKAFWNILNQNGKRCIVVGWWPSHPADPINGAMVSNHFPLTTEDDPQRPLLPGTTHPPEFADRLVELRIHGMDITGDILRLFVPDWQKVDQDKDKSLHDLAGIIAETMSIHAAATELMETESWDMAAVYFAGIDHFSHRFMRYHARKRSRPGTTDPALFCDVVANAYRYHDVMLGRLIQLAGPDAAVMVVSDHGFHSDSMLPDYIPAEAAGPAVEHRDFGIFCFKAPGVLQNERIYGASVLDITPTILHLFGLPAGADMDGKVLINAFSDKALPQRVPSWDTIMGEDGRHPPERQHDSAGSVEALKQLVDLGYIAPLNDDTAAAVRSCMTENRYNLARAHMDAGDLDATAELFAELIAEDSEQIRYHQHLFQCRMAQRRYQDCAQMLDTLDDSCAEMARRAAADLKQRRVKTSEQDLAKSEGPELRREMFERRQLAEKLGGFATERMLMRCSLLLAQGKPEDKMSARPLLESLTSRRMFRRPLAMFLAESYMQLGQPQKALEFTRRARRFDRDNWRALALEAQAHHAAGRFAAARDRAIASLSLVYLQPSLHHLLGLSLVQLGDLAGAERGFRVALVQSTGPDRCARSVGCAPETRPGEARRSQRTHGPG